MTKYYKENYPRPQFVRDSYLNLNGEWNFRFDDGEKGIENGWQNGFESTKIQVPFSYESKRSGIGCEEVHNIVWYSRRIDFSLLDRQETEAVLGERILLNLEGSDYSTMLWVNGVFVGRHDGGYARFTFDITDALAAGRNAAAEQNAAGSTVVLRVSDSLNAAQPRGKQRWLKENYDCWYVQTTGIWKSVWAEKVSWTHLERLHMVPQYDDNAVDFEFDIANVSEDGKRQLQLETVITFQDEVIASQRDLIIRNHYSKRFSLEHDNIKWRVKYWCPKSPNLYDVCVRIYENGTLIDEVGSYFGLRKISTGSSRIKLNNMDFYLRMVLDQGYWEESLLTPPDEEALKRDIDKILEYGYNGVRKHQKTEDELFYYWADVKGLLVWCEAPSFYEWNAAAAQRAAQEWIEIVRQHYNHPSVMAWVAFNESWGIPRIMKDVKAQHFTQSVYYMTKALDETRPVISNDGWEHTKSDIITLHDYAPDGSALLKHWLHPEDNLQNRQSFNGERYAFAEGFHYEGQPVMISEFGGIAYGNQAEGWGYGNAESSEEDFLARLQSLMEAIYGMDYLSGFCYTQLTDVQQEQNGHLYMDRRDKVMPEKVREIITHSKQ